jgi:hypothetical protein
MKISQGNFLCNYLKQKCHFSPFYKTVEQNRFCLGGWYQWDGGGGGERVWKDEYSANTVYTCLEMEEMRLVETILGVEGEGVKEKGGGGEFKYDRFDTL